MFHTKKLYKSVELADMNVDFEGRVALEEYDSDDLSLSPVEIIVNTDDTETVLRGFDAAAFLAKHPALVRAILAKCDFEIEDAIADAVRDEAIDNAGPWQPGYGPR